MQQQCCQHPHGDADQAVKHLPHTAVVACFRRRSAGGYGWSLHPRQMIAAHLARGELVELLPDTPLDVPLYWHVARSASTPLEGLTRSVMRAAKDALYPLDEAER